MGNDHIYVSTHNVSVRGRRVQEVKRREKRGDGVRERKGAENIQGKMGSCERSGRLKLSMGVLR
jgi:hypothetical protein